MSSHTRRLRRWYVVHLWSSLICTLFLLLICITGLPLVYTEEIDHLLSNDPPYATLPANTPPASVDRIVAAGLQRYPGQVVTSLYIDDDEPQVYLFMAPSMQALREHPDSGHYLQFDSRTAQFIKESDPPGEHLPSFTSLMFSLHTDLFAGLTGELFMGAMGLLFVVATVSGVVLYAPFMKKLDFGTVRRKHGSRIRWLDLHNLLGIATLMWVLIVGLTGVLNELATPLFGVWQNTDINQALQAWKDKPPIRADQLSSPQAAIETARKALPEMTVTGINYPGSEIGSPHHYMIWTKGNEALTSKLYTPVLVDAITGQLSAVMPMPWYLKALELSRPLHFGDYAGNPLKILWLLFDIAAIVILGSGLYLWFARHKQRRARFRKLLQPARAATATARGIN